MPALTIMPAPAIAATAAPRLSLYNIEENLEALVNCTEVVAAEEEAEFLAELERAMIAAKDKRDHVNCFLAQCESQAEMAKAEIVRLRKRQQFFESAVERMEGYVLHVILAQPLDAKGKPCKLIGNTSTFAARQNPPTVAIQDEALVPASCKQVSVSVPMEMWEGVLDNLPMDFCAQVLEAVGKPATVVLKDRVKEAIAQAVPDWKKQLADKPSVFTDSVPGCSIKAGEFRLVRT